MKLRRTVWPNCPVGPTIFALFGHNTTGGLSWPFYKGKNSMIKLNMCHRQVYHVPNIRYQPTLALSFNKSILHGSMAPSDIVAVYGSGGRGLFPQGQVHSDRGRGKGLLGTECRDQRCISWWCRMNSHGLCRLGRGLQGW